MTQWDMCTRSGGEPQGFTVKTPGSSEASNRSSGQVSAYISCLAPEAPQAESASPVPFGLGAGQAQLTGFQT